MRGEQNSAYEAARQTVERTVMSLDYNTHLTVNDEGDTVRGRTEKNKYEFVEKTKGDAYPGLRLGFLFNSLRALSEPKHRPTHMHQS